MSTTKADLNNPVDRSKFPDFTTWLLLVLRSNRLSIRALVAVVAALPGGESEAVTRQAANRLQAEGWVKAISYSPSPEVPPTLVVTDSGKREIARRTLAQRVAAGNA